MSTTQENRQLLVVIDDEEGFRDFVMEVAELVGFAVSGIADARDLAPALSADVIVLDLMMPGMDGIEVLRGLAQQGCRARLIFSSGAELRIIDSAARIATAHRLEVAARLQKPLRAVELRSLLEGLRERKAVATPRAKGYQPSLEELQQAIIRDELTIHCQPQVSFSDGRWIGVEALVRWNHPTQGLLFPDAFIGLAEDNDLGLPLTYRVLEQALRECVLLRSTVGFSGMLSVNVPPVALHDVSFPEEVLSRVNSAGGWPKLTFEVTETSVSIEEATALDVLTRLRMRGIGISIDDFGTGQSGLERLHHVPFTELKIDMQFVRAVESDTAARAIVEHSLALARDLGMTSVAEGVENVSLWHWLRNHGCDVAQGYFVSKPLPGPDLARWSAVWRNP